MFRKLKDGLFGRPTPPEKPESFEERQKAFRKAAIYGDIEAVIAMVGKEKKLVTTADKYGFTILHDVVGQHSVEMVKRLIGAGADVNAQSDEGIAPLHLAAYDTIAEALLSAGANLELETQRGETPLYIHATEAGTEEVMRVLLNHGANPEHKNSQGQTPLDVVLSRQENEKVQMLRKAQSI